MNQNEVMKKRLLTDIITKRACTNHVNTQQFERSRYRLIDILTTSMSGILFKSGTVSPWAISCLDYSSTDHSSCKLTEGRVQTQNTLLSGRLPVNLSSFIFHNYLPMLIANLHSVQNIPYNSTLMV